VLITCPLASLCSRQINETLSQDAMFDVIQAEEGMWFREHTPIDARVAISTHGTHFRPEMALAGRGIMTSYVGWVTVRLARRPSLLHTPFARCVSPTVVAHRVHAAVASALNCRGVCRDCLRTVYGCCGRCSRRTTNSPLFVE
jgi:hypothetical protein